MKSISKGNKALTDMDQSSHKEKLEMEFKTLWPVCFTVLAKDTPHLPRGLNALDDSQADQDPSHQQGQGHLPVQATCVVDGAGDV